LCSWSNQKVGNFFCNHSVGVLSRHNHDPQAEALILTEDAGELKKSTKIVGFIHRKICALLFFNGIMAVNVNIIYKFHYVSFAF
jgi:hypothetical protein